MKNVVIIVLVLLIPFFLNGQVLMEPALETHKMATAEIDTNSPLTYVEEMPEFIGGNAEMYKFISENMYVPDSCAAKGVTGSVVVRFVIDEKGYILKPRIVRGARINCGFNEVVMENA